MNRAMTIAVPAIELNGCMGASGAIKSSPDTGPAFALLAPETAGEIFARLCIQTEPSL